MSDTQRADGRDTVRADGDACGKTHKAVHQPCIQQGGGKAAAALAENAGQPVGTEVLQQVIWVDLPGAGGAGDQGRPDALPSLDELRVCGTGVAEQERDLCCGLRQLARQRQIPRSRTVSDGSSARAVPAPTITASWRARMACTKRRAGAAVIHWLSPVAVAMRPSKLLASFSVTMGRPKSTLEKKPM